MIMFLRGTTPVLTIPIPHIDRQLAVYQMADAMGLDYKII
jgi:hypothetical protein